ncbi:ARP1 actin-related protein 1-like protein A [Operophtera brumata]|uniref:ARP1 actin-related protein 1-like protein A n=1 Tax=Operophtera brumata TaxID=104452 RepID=A0A0L7LAV7_OPEBR|nr:ARP1 actin-related protein 1-like protein A [Operophtera brumata]
MAGALEGELFVGPRAEEHRGLLTIKYPMEHGIEHPVLLTEAPLNPRRNREKAAEVFFETFNVPALFLSMQAVLRDGVTHAVPIYEGFAMPHSIMRVDVAGRDVTRYLRTSAELEIVKAIKERACYLSPNPLKEETLDTERTQSVRRGSVPQKYCSDQISSGKSAKASLHEVLMFAIQKSDMDLRKVLYQNIVLSGGSTLFRGFGDRLLAEIRRLAPKDMKIRREYDEEGHRAVHRKTF